MDETPVTSALKSLQLTNSKAKILAELILIKIKHGHPFYRHGPGINLSWLAKEIGTSRQIFYPGRGSRELAEIISILDEHIDSLNTTAASSEARNKVASRTRAEFLYIRSENDALKQRLRKLERINNSFFSSSLLIDLTDDELPSN